jgi:phage terminase large subunit GpA-like protein
VRTKTCTLLTSLYQPTPDLNIWQWAEGSVDFSLEPRYETPLHGPYNADFLPMWKEIQENFTDLSIREQWIVKNSRAGCSENCLLNPLRYAVAVAPKSMQYITGDELSASRFMSKRIKLGLRCAKDAAKKYKRSSSDTKYDICFPDMDLTVTWPKNKMAFKQSGYEWILCDELSTWPSFSADMMRKRTDTYRYSHICGISSPDPQQKRGSDEDPIFQEFKLTDQRYWYLKDPKTGKHFKFVMGDQESVYGLKWSPRCRDENDEWDLDKVEADAHYVTPDGTRIDEADRWELVCGGEWMPENPDAPVDKRGYHMNSFYMPFKSGSFGHIARKFLEAKHKGPQALKVFVYEYLAEEWYEDKQEAEDDELYNREAMYAKGEKISQCEKFKDAYENMPTAVIMTVDVQKAHMWYVVREWIDGGNSGLIDYGYAVTWQDLEEIANMHNVVRVLVDVGYAQRAMEVYEYCYQFNAWPTKGVNDSSLPFRKQLIDPFEGKRGAGGENIVQYNFNTDVFKIILMDLIRGESEHKWNLYKNVERDYIRQVASEHRVDGEWKTKPGHAENHLWDCEVLQLLGATIIGTFRCDFL